LRSVMPNAGVIGSRSCPACCSRLNAALREALSADDVRARLAAEGAVPLPGTPEDYAADIDTEEETMWGALVRKLNLKVE
jgi:tripartite-type tricarboxylate transporter receptor subunit TctC